MLTFLIAQLQSFNRLFLVLSVVPMSLVGVVGALLVSGKPLGFVAILGILTLIGMIAAMRSYSSSRSRPSGKRAGRHGMRSSRRPCPGSAPSC